MNDSTKPLSTRGAIEFRRALSLRILADVQAREEAALISRIGSEGINGERRRSTTLLRDKRDMEDVDARIAAYRRKFPPFGTTTPNDFRVFQAIVRHARLFNPSVPLASIAKILGRRTSKHLHEQVARLARAGLIAATGERTSRAAHYEVSPIVGDDAKYRCPTCGRHCNEGV